MINNNNNPILKGNPSEKKNPSKETTKVQCTLYNYYCVFLKEMGHCVELLTTNYVSPKFNVYTFICFI